MNTTIPLSAQLINLCAAVILLLAFAMLAQRRVMPLINLFGFQGLVLAGSTLVVAVTSTESSDQKATLIIEPLSLGKLNLCCQVAVSQTRVVPSSPPVASSRSSWEKTA